MSRRFIKPVRPVLNRAQPLFRGLLFSAAPGWDKGYDPNGVVAEEDITRAHGDINGSLPGTFAIYDGGRTMTAGASLDATQYGAYAVTKANANSRSISCAILTRPRSMPGVSTAVMMAGKTEQLGTTFPGYRLNLNTDAGGLTAFEWAMNDGAGTTNVRGTNGVPNTTSTFLVVGTFNHLNDEFRLYVNGALDDEQIASRLPANNAANVTTFSSDANVDTYDGIISMIAIWNREIQPSEVARLWVDPYLLWKATPDDDFEGIVFPAPGGDDDNDCCPCCGGTFIHMFGGL